MKQRFTNQRFVVESGLPAPGEPGGPEGRKSYPFRQMAVGDSFLLEGTDQDWHRLRSAAGVFTMRNGWHFTVNKIGPGQWRCWRID